MCNYANYTIVRSCNRFFVNRIHCDKNGKELLLSTLICINEIKNFLNIKKELELNNWSKEKYKQEFVELGYKNPLKFRSPVYLRASYLGKLYLHMLSKPCYTEMRKKILNENWSKERLLDEFKSIGAKKPIIRIKSYLREQYLEAYYEYMTRPERTKYTFRGRKKDQQVQYETEFHALRVHYETELKKQQMYYETEMQSLQVYYETELKNKQVYYVKEL